MSHVKILRNGQITLPKNFRVFLGVKEGDVLELEMDKDKMILKPKILVDKNQAWIKLNQLTKKVSKKHKKFSEKETEEDVLDAIKTTRSK